MADVEPQRMSPDRDHMVHVGDPDSVLPYLRAAARTEDIT
jgi:hypothetical protein